MDFMKEYEKWLASPALSADEKAALREAWTLRRDSIKNKDVEDATINQ